MQRVYNFAAGPAVMPAEALTTAANEMLCYGDTGMSVMEMSHRSKMYQEIFNETEALVRELMHVPDDYAVLFIQGGATGQFAGVAMNLLTGSGRADYVDSGNFAHGAFVEAQKYGSPRCVASSREEGYVRIPDLDEKTFDPEADYFYITTNNTIYGTRYTSIPDTGAVPLVADASSNILSQPLDITRFGVLFAGAQKNIGPAGLCIVVLRKDLAGFENPLCPKLMSWALQIKNDSMLNTPNTYGIYMAKLGFEWLRDLGGVEAIYEINQRKAALLYDFLDNSRLFKPTARPECRSLMNVTFVTGDKDLDAAFVKYAAERGLVNLKGHRSVGGMRASIYNAMPQAGVEKLVQVMKAFEKENA